MAKLNLKDIMTIYGAATFASISTGLVGSYVWSKFDYNVDYGLVVSSTWLLTVGVPSVLVSASTLKEKLGERRENTVRAIGGQQNRRAIPMTANGRQSHIFLSSIPFLKYQPEQPQVEAELPTVFQCEIDGNGYSITTDELETFIRTAWKRQRAGNAGLSRPYWTRQHKPRLKPLEYYCRLNVLLTCNGLILDRSKRRSGRLSVSPALAIKALQGQYSLV